MQQSYTHDVFPQPVGPMMAFIPGRNIPLTKIIFLLFHKWQQN